MNEASWYLYEYQQRKFCKELGFNDDMSQLCLHDLRIFNIIDNEWKRLEHEEFKRRSRMKR